jgi:hypothetical protein
VVGTDGASATRCEVLASVVTTSETGGIDVPDWLLAIIRQTKCGLGFSFVSVGPDDDDATDSNSFDPVGN